MDAAFAALLKENRLAAGLTQEALAERAGLSVRSIQALERGESRPLRDTLRRLVDALALDAGARTLLMAAGAPAPRRTTAAPAPAAPPPDGMATRAPLRPPPPRHNLPAALTPLIGREAERAEVLALLAEARLVALTGSGGVGKTRLALAVAAELVDAYPDGVWLVELASLVEDRLVAQTVMETLGTREESGRPLLPILAAHLREKRLLLVLDNCEHLIEACAALSEAVLRACPGVRVLATSREALEVAGEVAWRVPSLRAPDPKRLPPPEEAEGYEAVRLFVARARQRRSGFALTPANVRAVAQVCARLDGIPLAIELAAARADSLGVEGIAARLDDRFRLLTGGPRTALPRQRTLRAALDWSYDLLTAAEQLLLDRLAVFAGGWTLTAAEAVCAGEGVERWEVLDLLGGLMHKSLVQAEEQVGGELRYRLLETVRQYGQERLAAAGAAEAVRDRHLAWYLALAEAAAPHLEEVAWLDRLEAEHDNLRAALRWAREGGDAEAGLRLAGALWGFWSTRTYFEGRGWLEGALAVGAAGSAAARAQALTAAGHLAQWQGDFEHGAALLEEGLALYRALDDTSGSADSLGELAVAVERGGDFARAMLLQEEALALRRAVGDRRGIAGSLTQLGWVAYLRGEYAHAVARCEESVALYREVRPREAALSLCYMARAVERQGAYARAAALQEEALALFQAVGNRLGIAWSLTNLGWALLALGEEGRATAYLEESVALSREVGDCWAVLPFAIEYLGMAAYRRDECGQAAALQEEALKQFKRVGFRWGIAWVLADLGCVRARGEYGQAAAYLKESLLISRAIGARGLLAEALEGSAWLAAAEEQPERAARLGGAAEALREALGAALHPVLHAGHERAVRTMRDALAEAAFAADWAEGRALPLEEAVTLALQSPGGSR